MKKIFNYILTGCIALFITNINAQDIHFSQIKYSPLNLNPALAGANNNVNAVVNYKNQWMSVSRPFQTIGASFDMRMPTNNEDPAGDLALGVNLFNDNGGDSRLNTFYGSLNLAYHLMLNKNSALGGGIYAGVGQRNFKTNDLQWGSQYDGFEHNPGLSSGEFFDDQQSHLHFDAGMGLIYTYVDHEARVTGDEAVFFNGGIGVFHLNRPNYSFIGNDDEKLFMRWSIFADGLIPLENSDVSFLPGIYYNRQGFAQELIFGSHVRVLLKQQAKHTGFISSISMSFGVFYRMKDALISKLMFQFDRYMIGLSYDSNFSNLTPVSNTRGGFEVFLRYSVPPFRFKERVAPSY